MMLWTPKENYLDDPFEYEKDLESAIQEISVSLFGSSRIYLEVKKKIGKKGKTQNIPDAYLIDLASKKNPTLYVVENELAKHDPLKHIAVQILQFSLSFESSPQKVKGIIKDVLVANDQALQQCQTYAEENGFENVDYLLERMIYRDDAFNAMVIIDEVPDELETVLVSRFKFPVEVLSLQRFVNDSGDRIYQFEPFLSEITESAVTGTAKEQGTSITIDPSDIDTIVIPAREDGFQEVFLGENCWYAIRIHSSMIPRIKYIAAYQVAPVSAITHIAKVHKIDQWKDTNKYVLLFEEAAKEIGPIQLVPKGKVKAPQGPRYTSMNRLEGAKTLDDAF
jgi:hypothetical protein